MKKYSGTLIFCICICAIIYAVWSMVYAPSGSWLLLIGMVIVWLVGFATGIVSCVIYKEIKDLNLKPLRQALNKEKIKIKNN